VLLHLTSLPSRFGIGDLGPEALRFAEFLTLAGQTRWQMLPIGPTASSLGNSPYSSFSAFAGNTLCISPEGLAKDGLITRKEKGGDAPGRVCRFAQGGAGSGRGRRPPAPAGL